MRARWAARATQRVGALRPPTSTDLRDGSGRCKELDLRQQEGGPGERQAQEGQVGVRLGSQLRAHIGGGERGTTSAEPLRRAGALAVVGASGSCDVRTSQAQQGTTSVPSGPPRHCRWPSGPGVAGRPSRAALGTTRPLVTAPRPSAMAAMKMAHQTTGVVSPSTTSEGLADRASPVTDSRRPTSWICACASQCPATLVNAFCVRFTTAGRFPQDLTHTARSPGRARAGRGR